MIIIYSGEQGWTLKMFIFIVTCKDGHAEQDNANDDTENGNADDGNDVDGETVEDDDHHPQA